jgi:hypothetical protein
LHKRFDSGHVSGLSLFSSHLGSVRDKRLLARYSRIVVVMIRLFAARPTRVSTFEITNFWSFKTQAEHSLELFDFYFIFRVKQTPSRLARDLFSFLRFSDCLLFVRFGTEIKDKERCATS